MKKHKPKVLKLNQAKGSQINLKDKLRQQSDALVDKDGKLEQGAAREKIADERILIQTKAMGFTLDGIFIIDAKKANFPVIYANSSFLTLTGYSLHEVMEQDYFHLYGADADMRVVEEIKQTMLKGKSFHGEMLNFRKDGKKFWSSLRISPIRDNKGAITHYVGIQTDSSLIKQRDLEIEEQREELLHVTRVGKLAEFVSSLAHEISQPLTAILSYAQAAQRLYGGKEPKLEEILRYIINDNKRASEVIRRLRLLLKKTKPVFESLDINILIRDTASLIMTHVTVKNKMLKFALEDNLPLVQGDRIQLQQVLLNLISNSLEAMDEADSRELSIATSRKDTSTILVEVKDSGSGILMENRAELFTHFFTTKPNGLGMGLPISRSIIETHGGRLEAENNSDRGANFYFTLPIGKRERP